VWLFGSAPPTATRARVPGTNSISATRDAGGFALVALGGEVVVDYALRLVREDPARQLWVAGYSNDVFGYVPSLRVLREGGYEGGDAMIYYAKPGPFNEQVEDLIVGKVHQLMGEQP
jgi:neutral ceramidase